MVEQSTHARYVELQFQYHMQKSEGRFTKARVKEIEKLLDEINADLMAYEAESNTAMGFLRTKRNPLIGGTRLSSAVHNLVDAEMNMNELEDLLK